MQFEFSQDPASGKWTIHDVPIFATVKKGEHPKATKTIGRKWLEEALAFSRARISGGYEYRANVNHHFSGGNVEPIGFFKLTRVGAWNDGVSTRDAVFADIFDISDEVMARFKNGELPSRSAEIFRPDGKPDIDVLSLLPTMPPFHKLPVTTARTLVPQQSTGGQVPALVAQDGPVSLYECGGTTVAVFSEVQPSMKGTLSFDGAAFKVTAADGAETVLEKGASFSLNDTNIEIAKFEAFSPDTTELDAAKATITELEAKVAKFEATPPAAPTDVSGLVASFGALRGEVETLKAETNETKLIDGAVVRLTEAGFQVGKEVKAEIATFAAHGETILGQYLDSFEKNAAPEPPASIEDAIGKNAPQDSDAVAKFVAQHPEKADQIRDAGMQHEELVASAQMKCSQENFIMDTVGIT